MAETRNKLTVCLIRSSFTEFERIIKDGAAAVPLGDGMTFFMEDSAPHPPSWIRDFFGGALDGGRLITSSAKGVLLVRVDRDEKRRIFAVIFGHGRHLLTDGVIEDRFGLKVVLNTVVATSLRSIDKTSLGSVPKQSREQMSREGAVSNFGIDIEQDLVNQVTGRSQDVRFGKVITGRDSLSASVKFDVDDITEFLGICLEKYESEAYRTDFDWIDQIKDVRNSTIVAELDGILVGRLRSGDYDKVWLAPPDIIDWVDVAGFRYAMRKRAPIHQDLDIADLVNALDDGDDPISADMLKQKFIFVVSAKEDEVSEQWPTYRCIYAEIEYDGNIFVLNNGKWYEIAADFTAEILASFDETPSCELALPPYAHANEGAYNDALPGALPGSCSMDRKMIMHGGGHSSIEFCDLLTADKRLIHVKHHSGATQFSHLFAQGAVSGELFVQDAAFRNKLNEKLPEGHKLDDPDARPNPAEFEIVYAIINKSNAPLDIPFFSKVSLRNARRRLLAYGYRVTKANIGRLPEAA